KQQALILGHATPMPVVVRTRAYDAQFYSDIGATAWDEMPDAPLFKASEAAKADLGF
ncbi:MAG: ATPase, partial [Cyanobacteria bacterium P01_A01_bin.70]